jgi:hypothetical protein
MHRGPVEVLFLLLPAEVSLAALATALRPAVDAGVIRIIDCVLLTRDLSGAVLARDLEDDEGLPAELRDLDIDANDLLSDGDIALFGEALGVGEVGLAVVYEEIWARDTVTRIHDIGAEVGLFLRVPPDEVEAAFTAAAV